MVEYFVGTRTECQNIASRMDSYMGYPDRQTKTDRYADIRQSAVNSSEYYVIIKSVFSRKLRQRVTEKAINDKLTTDEKLKKRDREVLKLSGAFGDPSL